MIPLAPSLDRVAGRTCNSCGFFDPTALEDDPELVEKIFEALNGGRPFKCHEGMPQNIFGHYVPTRAQQLAARQLSLDRREAGTERRSGSKLKTDREKVALCREIIRRGNLAPCIPSRGEA